MAKLAAAADGTVAEFDKQSIELSTESRANIDNLAESAAQAHRVEVTGYCDKQENEKNAKQVALTRAIAVRSELIKHGVPAKIIRTKYVTTEARNAVVVVLK
jgi:outer membrane protein OmpA-like peptidoglycan-associated protein